MIPKWKVPNWLAGSVLFAGSFLYLYWIAGDVLRMAGDEGIYLQAGRLVALGQQPYRDFFAIAGPLSFWIEGALAFASGMSLAAMRLPPVFDAAFLSWAVYWLLSRHAGKFYSASAAIALLAYQVSVRPLEVNHRWDSAGLSMGAILLASQAQRTGHRGLWAVSGLLIVAAACATPSMVLVALPMLFWAGWRNARNALAMLGGGALAAGIAAAYLQTVQALLPMIQSMRWNGANYTAANRVLYGSLFLRPLPGMDGWVAIANRAILLIPAILPPGAILAWALYLRPRSRRTDSAEIVPLLAVAAALVFSTWPRWGSIALLHTLALSWFLCALLLYRLIAPRHAYSCGLVVLLVSLGLLASKALAAMEYSPRESRVGTLRALPDESEFLAGLERWIQPGDSVFSYPYMASLYYFLDARNPTRYPYLQPGMMTVDDERRAIGELRAAPPRWVLYENIPAEAVLAIWPGSDPARIPMTEISTYLQAHYHPVETITGPWAKVVVMENNPSVSLP